MKINKIKLHNFRNILDQEINFDSKINVIFGSNGTGKTNILESIYFASIGRSPRTNKDSDCVNFSHTSSSIYLNYTRANQQRDILLNFGINKQKKVTLDGVDKTKISDIVGNFCSIYFSPDETQIIRGSPAIRRKFIDIINCQINKDYLYNLSTFQHLLLQRNTYLKKYNPISYNLQLETLDTQLATVSFFILNKRKSFVDLLNSHASKIHKKLSNNLEIINIKYSSIFNENIINTKNIFVDNYLKICQENFKKDLILGYTSSSLQNDDYIISLEYLSNNLLINLKKSGSLGQQRTATLSLKLAEIQILKNVYNEEPTLLLDDVFGELDKDRQQSLLEFCKSYQTILTCTSWDNQLPAKKFTIINNKIKEID